MKKLLEFENVSKQYQIGLTRTSLPALLSGWTRSLFRLGSDAASNRQSIWALRNVSFDLEPGDSLALVGPNGAGKTTALKVLANVTKPTAGAVRINGRLSALIELGAGFHPELTGRENIYLNGTILGLKRSEIKRRFDEIVAFSELEKFLDTPVKRYSSGMTVRLGFAVAASIDPEILLVDEVLAVGDASFRQKCLGRIQRLLKAGTSLIFISHNLYMVEAVCRRAIYLTGGEVKLEGETKEIIEAYEQDLFQEQAREFPDASGIEDDVDCGIDITRVEVQGETGPVSGEFRSSQPTVVKIGYFASAAKGPVNMSVFFRRADGLVCCMMRTHLDDLKLYLSQGYGEISLRLARLQLVSGMYFVEAYFLDESDSLNLTPKGGRSDWISVKGSGKRSSEDSGVFEPVVSWKHETGSDSDRG